MRKEFKEKWILLLLFIMFFSFSYSTNVSGASNNSDPPPGYKVLMLVSEGFGVPYFDAKDQFESWDWIVDTAGTYSTPTSCSRQDPQTIEVDFLIQNVDSALYLQYDCIFVPSGGHWDQLSTHEGTSELILSAYAAGLIISSLCVGKVVLARAGILNGVNIAYDINTWNYIYDCGAKMIQQDVVTDKKIVTGGPGGGLGGGGASIAPTIEVCEAIALAIQSNNIGLLIIGSAIFGALAVFGLVIFLKKQKLR